MAKRNKFNLRTSQIVGVQFSILSPEEILKNSHIGGKNKQKKEIHRWVWRNSN